jgi:hypothetical protein
LGREGGHEISGEYIKNNKEKGKTPHPGEVGYPLDNLVDIDYFD